MLLNPDWKVTSNEARLVQWWYRFAQSNSADPVRQFAAKNLAIMELQLYDFWQIFLRPLKSSLAGFSQAVSVIPGRNVLSSGCWFGRGADRKEP